ncbi:MAG: pyridoxal-phosphate dependent enzyme, partial [Firmicutes bacterium]|nr:pyridoxal-phosphate dependent enzyme [Bacillota bacterium]
RLLAEEEGLFVEPASAAGVAGILKLAGEGYFAGGGRVVCVLTGHGLKDPDTALRHAGAPPVVVEPELAAIERVVLETE